jgi:hypothetical protein
METPTRTYHRPVITALREWRVGTQASGEPTTPKRRWWLDLRVVAPICAAAIYVGVVVVRLPSAMSSFYQYTDFPEALRLGDAIFHGGWGQGIAVPSQSGVGPLWLVGLLHQVTQSDAAGMALGALLLVLATAFMVRTARHVIGTTPAIAVGVLCLVAPPVVAWEMLTPIAHGSTLFLTAVCAWQLVAFSQAFRGRMFASSIAVGLLAGVCVISDPLALAAAVAPWGICAVILLRRHAERRLPVLITAGAAVAAAGLGALLANANGIVEQRNAVLSPSIDGVTSGLRTVAVTLGQMISGAWYGDALGGAFAVAGIAVFAAVVYMATREVLRRHQGATHGRDMYVWFWVMSSAALIAALCVSGLGVPHSPINYQGHYVDGVWFAIAALLPIGLLRAGLVRRMVAVGIPCLALVGASGIARMPANPFQGPDYVDAPQLTAALQQLGVTHGYGGYWESYAIGWHTGERITALPLQQCAERRAVSGLCAYEFAAPAWYVAQPGAVFVIVSRDACTHDDLCIDAGSLAGLPAPEAVRNVGLLQVYVYAYDVLAGVRVASSP